MRTLRIPAVLLFAVIPGLGFPSAIPSNFANATDYLVFNGNSYPGNNLICPSGADGCGGAFEASIYAGSTPTGTPVPVTVWCVDYQLNVTTESQYAADLTSVNYISSDPLAVRYGSLDAVGTSSPAYSAGWANSVTAGSGVDPNSATYRYTLAAALVSQYVNDPSSGLIGGSAVNTAIQEAIWYVTYNNEYATTGSGDQTKPWAPFNLPAADTTSNTNFAYWVNYAEMNAANVVTGEWAVVSGPADSNSGTLLDPNPGNSVYSAGYPSYQTFLVQLQSPVQSHGTSVNPSVPEPQYYGLIALGLACMFGAARHYRRRRAA